MKKTLQVLVVVILVITTFASCKKQDVQMSAADKEAAEQKALSLEWGPDNDSARSVGFFPQRREGDSTPVYNIQADSMPPRTKGCGMGPFTPLGADSLQFRFDVFYEHYNWYLAYWPGSVRKSDVYVRYKDANNQFRVDTVTTWVPTTDQGYIASYSVTLKIPKGKYCLILIKNYQAWGITDKRYVPILPQY